jgi:probable F420-dependent oxidoreductase
MMRHVVGLPYLTDGSDFESFETQLELARAIEAAGLDTCRVTDHPFPVEDETRTGHRTFDPFVLLGCIARETKRLGLCFLVVVLPYRNPFVVANAVRAVDHASGGNRLTVGVAVGYLGPEFAALGVERSERDALADEGILAMKQAWSGQPVHAEGRHWRAAGNTLLPVPLTSPHPPIWMGGNSDRAIERAVRMCDGWAPTGMSTEKAASAGTVPIGSVDRLRERIAVLDRFCEQHGRDRRPDICFASPFGTAFASDPADPATQERIEELESIGVTAISFRFGAKTRSELLEQIAAWGAVYGSDTANRPLAFPQADSTILAER